MTAITPTDDELALAEETLGYAKTDYESMGKTERANACESTAAFLERRRADSTSSNLTVPTKKDLALAIKALRWAVGYYENNEMTTHYNACERTKAFLEKFLPDYEDESEGESDYEATTIQPTDDEFLEAIAVLTNQAQKYENVGATTSAKAQRRVASFLSNHVEGER